MPKLALIACVAANDVIGRNGTMPWHLPDDLKHFKALTSGKRIVMGRKTWESFSKPLPNREHVVISSQQLQLPVGVLLVRSLTTALTLPPHNEPVFIIGGSLLYQEALPLVTDMYLTELNYNVAGDTYFPTWDKTQFHEASREAHPDNFSFVHYVR